MAMATLYQDRRYAISALQEKVERLEKKLAE